MIESGGKCLKEHMWAITAHTIGRVKLLSIMIQKKTVTDGKVKYRIKEREQ